MPGTPPRKLGIDLVFDSDLLYIAEDLLLSALPGECRRASAGVLHGMLALTLES
jgi:hypothetical protein